MKVNTEYAFYDGSIPTVLRQLDLFVEKDI